MAIEKIQITDRESWLKLRQQDVTASVAGALLSDHSGGAGRRVHPYATAYALWMLKSGRITDDAEETPPMRRGRLLESVAVQMLREDRPEWKIEPYPVGLYYRDPAARVGATPDVLGTDESGKPLVVQIKSVEASVFRREWHDEQGDVTPPLWIVVQAILEAKLTGAERAFVAPLVVSYGLDMPIIEVPIHSGVYDRVKAEVAAFWALVESGTAPDPDLARDGEIIARIFPRDDGSEIDLSGDNQMPELVDQLVTAWADKKSAVARAKEAKGGIIAKMGAASFARIADGRRVSCKLQQSVGYTVGPREFRVTKILGGRA